MCFIPLTDGTMKRITLYQPRHIFAPEEGDGHIYLPSSLTTVAARVLAAGGEVDIQDGNLQKLDFQGEILGVNVIGSPYIPEVIDVRKQIEDLVGDDAQILLGGQVIGGLLPDQFERLFGENCIDGNDDKNLKKAL